MVSGCNDTENINFVMSLIFEIIAQLLFFLHYIEKHIRCLNTVLISWTTKSKGVMLQRIRVPSSKVNKVEYNY